MTDYTELVKALRRCAEPGTIIDECDTSDDCPYSLDGYCGDCMNNLVKDAASAIEALQAELEKKRTADCWGCKCEKVEPKRGEWTEIEDYDGDFHYQCSVCGEEWYFIDGTPADNNANYCPRCGAKMEVQDADK